MEGGAGGGAGFCGVGVGAVCGVLEGGAQGVDAFDEGIAGDAFVAGFFLAVGLVVLGASVGAEVVFHGEDFRGVEAGKVVCLGEGDECV